MFKSLGISLIFHVLIIFLFIGMHISGEETKNRDKIDLSLISFANIKETVPNYAHHAEGQESEIKTPFLPGKQKEIPPYSISNPEQVLTMETKAPVITISEQDPGIKETGRLTGNDKTGYPSGKGDTQGSGLKVLGSEVMGTMKKQGKSSRVHDFSYIRDMVQKKINYPDIARQRGWEGDVTVSFIISSSGTVEDINIVHSSGREILDNNAIEAVQLASPFPKLPAPVRIIIPLVYSLY